MIKVHLLGIAACPTFSKEPHIIHILHRHEWIQVLPTPVRLSTAVSLVHVVHSLEVPAGADREDLVKRGCHGQVGSLMSPILGDKESRSAVQNHANGPFSGMGPSFLPQPLLQAEQ